MLYGAIGHLIRIIPPLLERWSNLYEGGEVLKSQYYPQVPAVTYFILLTYLVTLFILPTVLFKLAHLLSKVPLQLHFTPLS